MRDFKDNQWHRIRLKRYGVRRVNLRPDKNYDQLISMLQAKGWETNFNKEELHKAIQRLKD